MSGHRSRFNLAAVANGFADLDDPPPPTLPVFPPILPSAFLRWCFDVFPRSYSSSRSSYARARLKIPRPGFCFVFLASSKSTSTSKSSPPRARPPPPPRSPGGFGLSFSSGLPPPSASHAPASPPRPTTFDARAARFSHCFTDLDAPPSAAAAAAAAAEEVTPAAVLDRFFSIVSTAVAFLAAAGAGATSGLRGDVGLRGLPNASLRLADRVRAGRTRGGGDPLRLPLRFIR